MKIVLAFFLVLFFNAAALAGCESTGSRANFYFGGTVTRNFTVKNGTDCLHNPDLRHGFVKSEILQAPKNGRTGLNDKRFIYMPNKGFIGQDFVSVRFYYNDKHGKTGDTILNITYKVE